MLSGFTSGCAYHAKSAVRLRFRNQPVKIRGILGNEPDPSGIGRHILGERHDRLDQRNRFEWRPSRGACDAAANAVTAYHRISMSLFAASIVAALDFKDQAAAVRLQTMKSAAKLDARARASCFLREALNQSAPLDNQVWIAQFEGGRPAIGEKLETANFVHDAVFASCAEQMAHAIGHN